MSITTKKGDFGQSMSPFGLLPKNHPFFDVIGSLDEAQAAIGLALISIEGMNLPDIKKMLSTILVQLSYIAGDIYQRRAVQFRVIEQTNLLEEIMAKLEKDLPPLKGFILPIGHRAAAQMHFARAIVRRAERHYVALVQDPQFPLDGTPYLNRLSDFLFLVARTINYAYAIEDTLR